MFNPHPSKELNRLFLEKPYQGAPPASAKFLFIGLDANYARAIENHAIYRPVLSYLNDGVDFWKTVGVHHPFLLPSYSGDGVFYHRSFSRIGFTATNSADVSFLELLHVPTCGRSSLTVADLDSDH